MSGDHQGVRVSACLTLKSADRPLAVEAWDEYGESDTCCVLISSEHGELILRADDPALIETELTRWAAVVRDHRLGREGQWEAVRRTAAGMVAASPVGKHGQTHWSSRAGLLLAVLMYAAELEWPSEKERRRAVARQALTHDDETALRTLEREAGDPEAAHVCDVLASIMRAAREERHSIWSAVADAIDAYAYVCDGAVAS
jgi:hypothetical protein